MKKQIIASVLAVSSILSGASAFAQVPQEVKGTRYETAVSVLAALGIMNGDENGEYRLDDTIIRSELTKMAVTAMGMEDAAATAKGSTAFDDVNAEHWASGYINVATNLGIIEGDGDGKFRPNEAITYREAVTIMVRATGYEPAAQNKGGYPKGYLTTASENKVLTGVQGQNEAEITRGNVAILTNNSLEVNKMEQTGFGTVPEYGIVDKTLLSDNLKTQVVTGQIKAIGNMTLKDVKAVNKSQIMIGDEIYNNNYSANNLLGYNVKAYAQKDSYNELSIILAMPSSEKNKAVEITSDLFEKLTVKNGKDAVVYFESEDAKKTTTAVIDSAAQLIYNNRSVNYSKELIDINDRNAFMSMLDTDGDGDFDILFVTEYVNYVVDYATSKKITDTNGNEIKLEDIEYKLYQGLSEITTADIKKWDIASVVESATDGYKEIYITRSTAKGRVSTKTTDGYVIDGVEYKAAHGFRGDISVGQNVEFCLDISGKIAGLKGVSTISSAYGYLTNAYETSDKDNVVIKFVDKSGNTKSCTLANKVKLNDVTKSDEDVLTALQQNGVVNKQLITYTLNSSDKVTEINTAKDLSANGGIDTDKFTLNGKLSDTVYTASTSKLGNARVTDNTVVFDVSDDSNVKITNKSIFSDGQKYTGYIYDMSENFDAGVIVLTDTAFKPEINAPAAVVKNISTGVNADDEDIDVVTLLAEGKEYTINAVDTNVLVKNGGKKLEKGDVIQYKLNYDKEIAGIRVLFDVSAKNTEFQTEPEKDMKLVYGKVTKKFANSLNVTVNNSSAMNLVVGESTVVYSVDTKNSKNGVTLSEFKDIATYDKDENNRVFIKLIDNEVKEIVIVK